MGILEITDSLTGYCIWNMSGREEEKADFLCHEYSEGVFFIIRGISNYILSNFCKRFLQSPDLLYNHKTLLKNIENC